MQLGDSGVAKNRFCLSEGKLHSPHAHNFSAIYSKMLLKFSMLMAQQQPEEKKISYCSCSVGTIYNSMDQQSKKVPVDFLGSFFMVEMKSRPTVNQGY